MTSHELDCAIAQQNIRAGEDKRKTVFLRVPVPMYLALKRLCGRTGINQFGTRALLREILAELEATGDDTSDLIGPEVRERPEVPGVPAFPRIQVFG